MRKFRYSKKNVILLGFFFFPFPKKFRWGYTEKDF